jgi:hypothetical protein
MSIPIRIIFPGGNFSTAPGGNKGKDIPLFGGMLFKTLSLCNDL